MTADTSRKGFLMPLNDDIRKTLTDPTPLYFAAGVLDKIREEAPGAIAAVRATDPKEVQAKVTDRAKETQVRMNEALGSIDTDIKKLREQAQSLAMQGLGYAAEYAVKAREAYGDLAERGRGAVQTWRGDGDRPEITVERESVRVAQPPKQPRNGSSSARAGTRTGTGAGTATRAGTGTGSSNGAKSANGSGAAKSANGSGSQGAAAGTTARSTSAKAAAPKSTAAKNTAAKSANGNAKAGGKGSTGGSTPKSGS
ncbi:hypothetical protein RM572_07405 [Streptomyces sp. DSM 42041]|uniref:Uncharacterized protein n=1 Tax=Streptomyces hazeniae TaxID=3075538 RepID=A0ABU2NNP6_9ACTN|nr:hypothetical protein [Streptomyces sp. DSM 42041]MDT0378605.1 hypothetical protein [Streptomyces sp. DSM 42041]